jgi:phosphoribosyl-AMP cyclohydrolase
VEEAPPAKQAPPANRSHTPIAEITAAAAAAAVAAVQQSQQSQQGQQGQQQEKLLTLLNVTYAQVHSLYTFNIATGMIYSWLRNPSWTREETSGAIPCPSGQTGCVPVPEMYATVANPAPREIDPVLFFTVYAFGKFDAERKWHWTDLKPEPSIGLSLSSPSTDFFGGGSSEVWRGVQVVYGVHRGKINALTPTLTNDPTSSAAPLTTTHFANKFFFGVTFNITFIQTLFGGGKGGGG